MRDLFLGQELDRSGWDHFHAAFLDKNRTEMSEIFGPRGYEAKEGPSMRLLDPTVFVLGETAHMSLAQARRRELARFANLKDDSLREAELLSWKTNNCKLLCFDEESRACKLDIPCKTHVPTENLTKAN